jgi:nucleotide-binding universal stress UspA family protein
VRILVAIDGGPTSDEVMQAAEGFADASTELHVLRVVRPSEAQPTFTASDGPHVRERHTFLPPLEIPRLPAESGAQAAERVRNEHRVLLARRAPTAAGRHWTPHVDIDADAASAILHAAEDLAADAIVVGTRGRGKIAQAILGSVAHTVAARARIPVVIVPPGYAGEAER